jgi:putative SOS response-associated peptidase YedK
MCNRYACDLRKAGKERDYDGFEDWSETRIDPILGNGVLDVFPKSFAPVLKLGESGTLAWQTMRWGLPGPRRFGSAPVATIGTLKSPHWRALSQTQHRCLVPFTAFSDYEDASPKGRKVIRWFAPRDRSMLFFAGIACNYYGDYGTKTAPYVGDHTLFAVLTTDANALVGPVHAKAMPVILAADLDCRRWLSAKPDQIEAIQARALPNAALEIVSDEDATHDGGRSLK